MPALINDLISYLIGRPYQGYGASGQDDEDTTYQHTSKSRHAQLYALIEKEVCQGPFHDPEIEGMRNTMKPEDYAQFLSLFQRFLNYYPDEKKQ
jgi:hypothetical protein